MLVITRISQEADGRSKVDIIRFQTSKAEVDASGSKTFTLGLAMPKIEAKNATKTVELQAKFPVDSNLTL